MDWILQLSEDPPSIMAGVILYLQLAFNWTPTPGAQTAMGNSLSVTVT
jgi:hypothetical protein